MFYPRWPALTVKSPWRKARQPTSVKAPHTFSAPPTASPPFRTNPPQRRAAPCAKSESRRMEDRKTQRAGLILHFHFINPSVSSYALVFFRDITNMKGTIVAQVDSSESFQEFCSTGCLGAYENKQNPPKSGLKSTSKCTVCGKLTEVRPIWRS